MVFSHRSPGASRAQARAIVDIGTASVAGALVAYPAEDTRAGAPGSVRYPYVHYEKRTPILPHENEPLKAAVKRSITLIIEALATEGVRALAEVNGGRVSDVLVSVEAPWQTTSIQNEQIREQEPFVFTKRHTSEVLARIRKNLPPEDAEHIEERVVDIRMNGYQTKTPYGKRTKRVDFTILISSIDVDLIAFVVSVLKKNFHREPDEIVGGPALRYQVLRAAFPHEDEALILDVSAQQNVVLSLIRAGNLVAVSKPFTATESDETARLALFRQAFGEIVSVYPLPRTILLIANEPDIAHIKKDLGSTELSSLWLSDTLPAIIPVNRSQTLAVQKHEQAGNDVRLALMARYLDTTQ